MTLTPDEIDALPDYTAAQMLKLWRHVLAQLGSEGPEVSVAGPNNRTYTHRNLDEVRRMADWWEIKAAEEAVENSGIGPFEFADLRS